MSAIAALYRCGDDRCQRAAIEEMVESMVDRGPNGIGTWAGRGIALGCALLATVPEDRARPVVDSESGCAIVMDGRLDGRDELAALCGIDRRSLQTISDGEAVLRAYLARGVDAFSRLRGDFAFAIWDGRTRTLICGRDVIGLRPLYYGWSGDTLVAASELHAILRGRSADPNPGFLAEVLAGTVVSREETAVAGVYRVPAGSLLVAREGRHRIVTHSRLTALPLRRYARESDYADECRDVLTAAVRDRLRGATRAAVMLSGGIDSASVYAAARQLADVSGYTVSSDRIALDETHAARSIVERNGGRHYVVPGASGAYDYRAEIVRYRDLPSYPTSANSAALRARAAADGVGILLTGVGGDEFFFGHSARRTDWLVRGRWRQLWREVHARRLEDDPVPWPELVRTTVSPLVPRPLRALLRRMRPTRPYPWLTADFMRETRVLDRIANAPAIEAPSYATRGMIRSVADGDATMDWDEQDRIAARFHGDERAPYLDRRVIDFALSIPESIRARPGCPKYVTRRAWSALLPPAIVKPVVPPDYSHLLVDALVAMGGEPRFERLELGRQGWIDLPVVRRMARQLFSTGSAARADWSIARPLWIICSVDEWYRAALAPTTGAAIASAARLQLH